MDSKEPKKQTLRTRHDFLYFQIAIRYTLNFKKSVEDMTKDSVLNPLQNLSKEIDEIKAGNFDDKKLKDLIDKHNLKDITSTFFGVQTFAHIVVVFSAMCLESLINDYCVIKKSANYFKKYIEKLDTVSKWIIVPKIITTKEIPTDSQAIELLRGLFKLRNNMVHPKSKEHDSLTGDSFLIEEYSDLITKKIPLSFRAIRETTFELNKLDPSFKYLEDYKWLWDKNTKFSNISDVERFYSYMFGSQDK